MTVRNFGNITPRIAASAYIDERALVIGDVTIGDGTVGPVAVKLRERFRAQEQSELEPL